MKVLAATAAALMLAGAAQAQTASAPPTPQTAAPASDLTRDLNSGPPAPAAYIAPAPALVVVPAPPAARPTTPAPSPAASVARPVVASAPNLSASGATPPPSGSTPARVMPIPASPSAPPSTAPITPSEPRPVAIPTPLLSAPAVSPVPAPAPPPVPPPPSVSTITVLDAATRAALPFSVTLPTGFEIVTGRPGPDFRIYTIRRGEQSFVMVYAGPASQFPIYSGQMVETGGRASIISTEEGVRHAMEHLFQRPDAPREVHVWTMSLDGGDRALAEQIAQSVDIR